MEVPRRPVIYTRYRSEADVEATFLPRYVELLRLAEEHHLASFGPIRAVLYEHYTWQFHARTQGEPLGDLELNQDVSQTDASFGHIRYYGGFQAVSAVHVGPFRQMEALHTRMAEWAAAKGHRVCGVSIQEYIVGRTITSDEENFVTRIYLPVDVETI